MIDTGGNTIVNHSLMEATGGGTLVLSSDVDNSCGTIEATGCNSTVVLNPITISNGTLTINPHSALEISVGNDDPATPRSTTSAWPTTAISASM